jgi:integrase
MSPTPGPKEGPLGYTHGVKRLADKTYRIVYDVPPSGGRPRQQKRETLLGVTKKEAEATRAKRIEEVTSGRYVKDDDMTLSELFERFMAQKRSAGLESTTLARYQNLFDCHLIPAFGKKKVKELKQSHLVNQYVQWLQKGSKGRRISARTIHHIHETLRNVLNYGVRMEYVTRNVAAFVNKDDLPKVIQPKPKALTKDELSRLLVEAKNPTSRSKKRGYLSSQPWFYPAVFFGAYTGCRRGEICALRWQDVNFEEGTVTIGRSVTERLEFKTTKNDKVETITMEADLAAVLKTHRAAQAGERLFLGPAYNDQGLVFAHADGSPIKPWNFGRAVKDLIRRSRVTSITLHGLRRTHGSLMSKEGVAIEVIRKRLRHSNIAVTMRYLDIGRDREAEAAGAFERLMRGERSAM